MINNQKIIEKDKGILKKKLKMEKCLKAISDKPEEISTELTSSNRPRKAFEDSVQTQNNG